uniref:Ig-like domain-containing protein n=1 Tax=Cynoglossus semilaevis TaxID=244447 RepID=A0A3P8WC41_CYNSE
MHNKYAIAEELGRGQFSVVHRCVSVSSQKTYMAKFFKRGVFVAKVKIAPFEHGPMAGQVGHIVASEGEGVKFICHIDNYDSTTEVTWYCGVRQLEAGDKYSIEYEDGLAVISISRVTRADDGTYSAYAELFVNGVRSYRDFFTTRVVKRTKRRFTLPLVNRTAYIGEHVRFSVTVTVHPEPRVIWHKSGQKLIPGQDEKKYTFISDTGLYQMIVHKLEIEDDAEYSVVVRNRYGEDSCKARLTVVPRPKPADLTLRPMFKRLLANVECKEGQNVRFEIRVSGRPMLKWEKDGAPLAFGPSVELVHEGLDYYILHVRDTLPADSGVYRVTASNSAGSASCQALLKVEPNLQRRFNVTSGRIGSSNVNVFFFSVCVRVFVAFSCFRVVLLREHGDSTSGDITVMVYHSAL